MPTALQERRECARLRLPRPMLGSVDGSGALILDIGLAGLLVEHYGRWAAGEKFVVSVPWRTNTIRRECEIAHTRVLRVGRSGSAVSLTGARFTSALADSEAPLESLLAEVLHRVAEAQIENAQARSSDGGAFLERLGEARRVRSQGFLRYRFHDGAWEHAVTDAPMQPPDGFTVAAHEDEDDLRLLCDAYAGADAEGRELIRRVARLSAHSVRKLA